METTMPKSRNSGPSCATDDVHDNQNPIYAASNEEEDQNPMYAANTLSEPNAMYGPNKRGDPNKMNQEDLNPVYLSNAVDTDLEYPQDAADINQIYEPDTRHDSRGGARLVPYAGRYLKTSEAAALTANSDDNPPTQPPSAGQENDDEIPPAGGDEYYVPSDEDDVPDNEDYELYETCPDENASGEAYYEETETEEHSRKKESASSTNHPHPLAPGDGARPYTTDPHASQSNTPTSQRKDFSRKKEDASSTNHPRPPTLGDGIGPYTPEPHASPSANPTYINASSKQDDATADKIDRNSTKKDDAAPPSDGHGLNNPQQATRGCVGRLVTYPVLAAAFLTFLIIGGIIGGLYINTGVQDIQKPTPEVETTGHRALDTPYAAGQHPEDTPYSSGHSAMDTSSPRGHPAHCTSVGKDFTGFTFSALMLKLYTNNTMINFNATGI